MMLYNMYMIIVMHIVYHLLLGRPVLPPPLGLQLLLRLGQARHYYYYYFIIITQMIIIRKLFR
jgi:hypothetical protein